MAVVPQIQAEATRLSHLALAHSLRSTSPAASTTDWQRRLLWTNPVHRLLCTRPHPGGADPRSTDRPPVLAKTLQTSRSGSTSPPPTSSRRSRRLVSTCCPCTKVCSISDSSDFPDSDLRALATPPSKPPSVALVAAPRPTSHLPSKSGLRLHASRACCPRSIIGLSLQPFAGWRSSSSSTTCSLTWFTSGSASSSRISGLSAPLQRGPPALQLQNPPSRRSTQQGEPTTSQKRLRRIHSSVEVGLLIPSRQRVKSLWRGGTTQRERKL